MTRPLSLARLTPMFQHLEPDSPAWVQRLQATADQVYALLQHPDDLTDGQFAAVTSLADSVSMPTFTGSTLNRLLDAGNQAMAYYEFQKWVIGTDPATGQPAVLPDLIARRNAEQAIFLS